MTEDEKRTTELRSFGRRRGRKPSPRQQHLIDDLLPALSLDLSRPFSLLAPSGRLPAGELEGATRTSAPSGRLPAGESEGATKKPLFLEIGFGGGEHLVWQAKANPHALLIGCEPYLDGVVKVLDEIENAGLTNIRLHDDDARPLLRWLPDGCIDCAFVLFPDPWPKKRHVKRRLVAAPLLRQLARVMKPSAELRIGTDIGDYARTILIAVAAEGSFEWTARRPADWRVRPDDWPQTRYEMKALREGRQPYFFRLRRR